MKPTTADPSSRPSSAVRALLGLGHACGHGGAGAQLCAYVFGWAVAHVPPQRLPELWNLPVGEYLQRTGMPTGLGLAGAAAPR
jgi:hypothetical protein